MSPKPFPYPLAIGVDLVQQVRVRFLMEENYKINKWAQHVFSRLEWPFVSLAFQNCANTLKGNGMEARHPQLILPDIWEDIPRDLENGVVPPIRQLIQFLAGRWAMKEAAIKAHHHRKVFLREISVLPFNLNGKASPGKPQVLIDPPRRVILMGSEVASIRGLKDAKADWMKENKWQTSNGWTATLANGPISNSLNRSDEKIYERQALVEEDDRQVVEGNISHDGDYVIAMCMTVDEKFENSKDDFQPNFDNGFGNPVHEPRWGDKGFLGSQELDNVEEAVRKLELMRMKSQNSTSTKTRKHVQDQQSITHHES